MYVNGIVFPKTIPIVLSHPTTARKLENSREFTKSREGSHGREKSTWWDIERSTTSEKKGSQKLCDGTRENTERPRESTAGTFHFFFDVTQNQRNWKAAHSKPLICTYSITLCNLLPQESVATVLLGLRKGVDRWVLGIPRIVIMSGIESALNLLSQSFNQSSNQSAGWDSMWGDHPHFGLANWLCLLRRAWHQLPSETRYYAKKMWGLVAFHNSLTLSKQWQHIS